MDKLFSLTADDFEWSYTRASGSGGQKVNKTSSAVHCFHRPSGSHGYSQASRSRHKNKRDAFEKCVNTKEFKSWLRLEVMKKSGKMAIIEAAVDESMKDYKLKVECKDDGKWCICDV
jgi:protein subunit release factor A